MRSLLFKSFFAKKISKQEARTYPQPSPRWPMVVRGVVYEDGGRSMLSKKVREMFNGTRVKKGGVNDEDFNDVACKSHYNPP